MVNIGLFDHLGPRLGPSGPFWTISDKNDFFAPNGQNRVLQRCFGAKYQFCFVWDQNVEERRDPAVCSVGE